MWYTWPGSSRRQPAGLAQTEARVARGGGTARGVRVVEPLEEETQRRGLELVEARVVAHELERLLVFRAVEAQQADPLGELGVARRDEPAVADAREVLRREEAEGAREPVCSRAPVAERSAERLGGVLDDGNSLGQAVDRHGPAEEVDGNDGLRARSDPSCHVLRFEVQGLGVDIREDGRGTHPCDRFRRREEREGRAYHLVPAADLEGVEHEDERVGAVRDADRVRHAEVRGSLPLERLDLRAQHVASGRNHGREPSLQLVDDRRQLRPHVDERNGHGAGVYLGWLPIPPTPRQTCGSSAVGRSGRRGTRRRRR